MEVCSDESSSVQQLTLLVRDEKYYIPRTHSQPGGNETTVQGHKTFVSHRLRHGKKYKFTTISNHYFIVFYLNKTVNSACVESGLVQTKITAHAKTKTNSGF